MPLTVNLSFQGEYEKDPEFKGLFFVFCDGYETGILWLDRYPRYIEASAKGTFSSVYGLKSPLTKHYRVLTLPQGESSF
ncbi:MAG: hypothetical protein COV35_04605 [Alphaproteobacteria bacterium CG11_big_fil_rev_8_21_14_0_20_39_49]|nr:MAG: hypothetical protein COV35_04605 [Alphaproteobacteria bacterium CG11_big_fil_rev_8_21_14_0_20_39_49]